MDYKCKDCNEKKENWICLICKEFFCSRYINSHFVKHNEENKSHNICLSMMDLSFWCYDCEYYITNPVNKILIIINKIKLNKI
jgi:NAD-dependent histone deacetylase SIR2/NAD-dependent deacetylase sirtuin 2